MNAVYLVESGKYSRDGLNDMQKAYLRGIRDATEELECASDNLFDDALCDLGYEHFINEICVDAVRQCRDWLYSFECENIVSFEDENASELEASEIKPFTSADLLNSENCNDTSEEQQNKTTADIKMFIAGLERAIAEIDSLIENAYATDSELSDLDDDIRLEAAEVCKEWINAVITSIEDGTCDCGTEIH